MTLENQLTDIIYPDNHTRIQFNWDANRKDWLYSWQDSRTPHRKNRLISIQTVYDPTITYAANGLVDATDGDTEVVISTTAFNYYGDLENPLFPNMKWQHTATSPAVGRTLTLKEVVQRGKNNSEISKISFEYIDFHAFK